MNENENNGDELPVGIIHYPINEKRASNLFARAENFSDKENFRKTLTHTITPQMDEAWRDFLQTYSGTLPRKGKGISSALVELSMLLLMGMVADFKLEELAKNVHSISNSPQMTEEMAGNLAKIVHELNTLIVEELEKVSEKI